MMRKQIHQHFDIIYKWFDHLVSRHLSEGGIKLLSDRLELVLLSHKLILQPVNLVGKQNDC